MNIRYNTIHYEGVKEYIVTIGNRKQTRENENSMEKTKFNQQDQK